MKNNRAIATIDTTNTNIITFGAKWDMFIIPNPAHSLLDDWMPAAYAEKMVYAMANLDKANFNPGLTIGEKMVQVWYCNDKCENGVRHYPHVTDQDGKRWDIKFDIGEYFPESFAKRLHEGETGKFNIPVTLEYWDEETETDFYGYAWIGKDEYGESITLSLDKRWGGHEVIGTIYDNPELLAESDKRE